MNHDAYDVVVAGSGAAGCALAAGLAEAGARVLLLERGGPAPPPPDPADALVRYYSRAGFQFATGNVLLPVPTGTAVGGTTVINSGTCFRPAQEALRRWEEHSGGRFQAAELASHVEEAWRRLRAKPVPEEHMKPGSRLLREGLRRLGIAGAHPLDRAVDGCEASGRCCFVCPLERKVTADRAFLAPLSGRPELELATGAALLGVEPPRRGGPMRVAVRAAGGRRKISCGNLVLACGALVTPGFVRRFRLGPRWRAAGDNLSLHPAAEVAARFPGAAAAGGVPQDLGLADPGEPRIRYEGVAVPAALRPLTLPLTGRALWEFAADSARIATFGFMIRDRSRGRVRHPFGLSRPLLRYRMLPEDHALVLRGMAFLARAYLAAGAAEVLLPFHGPRNRACTPSDVAALDPAAVRPQDLHMMAFHPLGTCGMGRVVDEDLRLRDGIYACDGSVVPESIGVNPQVTIYAFALRLAAHLRGAR